MDEALSRREYPSVLGRLPPAAAVSKLNERVKIVGKVNTEIADWLQERRKVEDAYVAGLRKLSKKSLQESGGDLGIFEIPWKTIMHATETIAASHATLSQGIEKDVEQPLRSFAANNREMTGMVTIQGNLGAIARELDDAQSTSDKLAKKGGKVNSQKVEIATSKLQTASSQWTSQSPYVFETLQAVDERRLNHLRDVLTQYETHEADQVERVRKVTEQTVSTLLEIDTSQEIKNWSQANASGRPMTERSARQLSTAGSSNAGGSIGGGTAAPAPQTPQSTHADNASVNSSRQDEKSDAKESKFSKSRFGTMLNRRRQSVHGGFARAPSPSKSGFTGLGRNSASREGGRPSPSPQASSNNLRASPSRDNRLSSLAESPTATSPTSPNGTVNNTNAGSAVISDAFPQRSSSYAPNGTTAGGLPDLSDVQPPPGPPPSHTQSISENRRDSEGFTVPGTMNDPISQAQQEAAQEAAQSQFKLDIKSEPIPEQDSDAQAALSSVSNTLRSSHMVTPNRKLGTVRGRRDVRNTIFVPTPSNSLDVMSPEHAFPLPPSPGIVAGRAATLATLSSSEQAPPSASDATSIRSGHSLSNVTAKHAEMHQPGLNASIVETMHVSIDNGQTQSVKVNGEISLVYNKEGIDVLSSSTETIRINNFPSLEAIGENRTFISPVSKEKPDEFTLSIPSITPKPAIAFNYRMHIDEAEAAALTPILIWPEWKPKGDKFDFIVNYRLNPAYSTEPVTFYNLGLIARYTGGRATGCQSKPSGTHNAHQSCVYWRWGELTLTNEPHKLICRLLVAEGAMPTPGQIDAKFEIHNGSAAGLSLSRLQPSKGKDKEESADPFADDSVTNVAQASPAGIWTEIETSRKLTSGKYEARGTLPFPPA